MAEDSGAKRVHGDGPDGQDDQDPLRGSRTSGNGADNLKELALAAETSQSKARVVLSILKEMELLTEGPNQTFIWGGKDADELVAATERLIVGLGVILVLLVVFIAQNTRTTTVSFLVWDGQVPVAVALLIAAVAGLFLAGLAGMLRILQLRRRVHRARR